MAIGQQNRTTVVSILQIGISHYTKWAIKDCSCRDSHIYRHMFNNALCLLYFVQEMSATTTQKIINYTLRVSHSFNSIVALKDLASQLLWEVLYSMAHFNSTLPLIMSHAEHLANQVIKQSLQNKRYKTHFNLIPCFIYPPTHAITVLDDLFIICNLLPVRSYMNMTVLKTLLFISGFELLCNFCLSIKYSFFGLFFSIVSYVCMQLVASQCFPLALFSFKG